MSCKNFHETDGWLTVHIRTYILHTKGFMYSPVEYIIRSHEVKDNGYEVNHNGKCITVFSAPNYWYVVCSYSSLFEQVLNYT